VSRRIALASNSSKFIVDSRYDQTVLLALEDVENALINYGKALSVRPQCATAFSGT
jgi:hypothetical protein